MRGMNNFFWHITKLHQSAIENKKNNGRHSGSSIPIDAVK